jgi:hypothetical protein
MSHRIKPPLGYSPFYIWNEAILHEIYVQGGVHPRAVISALEDRADDVADAMDRYGIYLDKIVDQSPNPDREEIYRVTAFIEDCIQELNYLGVRIDDFDSLQTGKYVKRNFERIERPKFTNQLLN